jgi:hypothetical protein
MEFFEKISFDGFENPARLVLTFVFVLLYLVFSYRGLQSLNSANKFVLFILRIIIIILIILICGEVSIKTISYIKEKTDVAVLIDTSKSMSMKSGVAPLTRLGAVKEYFKNNQELFENIRNDHNLIFYSFNKDVEEISENAVNEITPDGNSTDILKALNTALQKSERLSVVLLFSDGVDTEGLSRNLSDFKFPVSIFAFSPGAGTQKDLGLKNLASSGFALNREKYEISFDITMNGWRQLDVPVTLKSENAVIKTERVSLKNGETKTIRMEFTPLKVGKQLYTIETPVFTGDDYPENNRISFVLKVLRDRLRVLLLSGKPHWDLRFLRQVLKTSPWVDLVNFNILRTPFDLVNIPEVELSLIPFPAEEIFREGLDSFDVFVMQNFDPTQFVPPVYLNNVKHFVSNGGGLAIVGGTLLSRANFYLNSGMADVVPVSAPSEDKSDKFKLVPQQDALNHPVNRFIKGGKQLPGIDFVNGVRGIKPWATVLVETEKTHMPVVVAGNYGNGRVLAVFTNSLWRLAFSQEERTNADAYVDFWLNALRWLSGEPEESNIIVESAKDEFWTGEKVKLNVKALDRKYLPLKNSSVEMKVVDSSGGKTIFDREWKGSGGEEPVEFNADNAGIYNVVLQVREGNKITEKKETKILVKNRRGEMDTPFPNDELLKKLAENSGGEFFELTDRVKKIRIREKILPASFEERKRPLWNSFFIYICTIFLLSLEWGLRRRWGLR